MDLTRRRFLQASGAASALLLTRPFAGIAATPLGGVLPDNGAARTSPLVPGRFLIHSDLHNHSLLSDGDGDPGAFYPAMAAAGLDTACLTDHGIMGKFHGEITCRSGNSCSDYIGINETRWGELVAFADEHDRPGEFVAFRAFEWSSATLGHLNVWFSEQWIDAVATGSLISPRATRETRRVNELPDLPDELFAIFNQLPDTASIDGFYEWLATEPGSGPLGGGLDGLAGFNHPNEFGDFEGWKLWPDILDRVVSCEIFNSGRDFFFWENEDDRSPWTLNSCLNAGWRIGLLGTSDEHSDVYARPNMGRGGLWVKDLTREGVREAMQARAMFASLEHGVRLAATAGGVQMGNTVAHTSGPLDVVLDLDRGPGWEGKELVVQVVRPGEEAPTLADEFDLTLGKSGSAPIEFTVDADVDDGNWFFLRFIDPDRPATEGFPSPWDDRGGAAIYSSPWWLDPDGAPNGGGTTTGGAPTSPAQSPVGGLPATGGGAALAAAAVLGAAALRGRRGGPHGADHTH